MGVSVFSQVWKASDVYSLRDDLGDASRPVLHRSAPWSEDASALYVDSLINGFPLTPLVVQSCRDSQGKSRLRVLGGWLDVRERGVMRSDEYVCEKARNSPRVVVRRPGEVDAIVDKYEGEPSFVCVNGYTGEECEFRVGELQPGTVIFVEDDREGDIMFAYVDGVAYEEMWRVTNHYGDVFEVDEPSVDRLAPVASGRLPVVYPVLD